MRNQQDDHISLSALQKLLASKNSTKLMHFIIYKTLTRNMCFIFLCLSRIYLDKPWQSIFIEKNVRNY